MQAEQSSQANTLARSMPAVPAARHAGRAWMRYLWPAFGISAILLLAAFLRFYQLGAHNVGNEYYAATVKSMLSSWHNFFFVSFEPGGSVTVDKPPLGFWIQAASAAIFGVNGFALALPQALAGVLSVALLYHLVKRQFGVNTGLISALVLAVMPVTVATERNNTIDGTLILVLLLAAWAFIRATETGRLRYVLLGAVLVGLGFNIKMLQAFLPVPAFYALYLLAGRGKLWKRVVFLVLATVVMLGVSLSWAIVVDLTPPDQRPYIGSSQDNTVMELIMGHNGLKRLFGGQGGGQSNAPSDQPPAGGMTSAIPLSQVGQPPDGGGPANPPSGQPPAGGMTSAIPLSQVGQPPAGGTPPGQPGGDGGSNPFSWETGSPGVLRMFQEPLVAQASWILPLALFSIMFIALQTPLRRKLAPAHQALLLWGGWLLTEVVFFSVASLYHRYYLIMLGPPLAALVGIGVAALWKTYRRRGWLGWLLMVLVFGATLAFQIFTLREYPEQAAWLIPAMLLMAVAGLGGLLPSYTWAKRAPAWLSKALLALVVAALLIAPFTWAFSTATNAYADTKLPFAGPNQQRDTNPNISIPVNNTSTDNLNERESALLDYLTAQTQNIDYLLAMQSANEAAPFILETGRPVLTIGGFSGGDPAVTVEQFAGLVQDGQLRYAIFSTHRMRGRHGETMRWVEANCSVVEAPGMAAPQGNDMQLYDCAGN